jgi:alpha-L-arabinofuranosidase
MTETSPTRIELREAEGAAVPETILGHNLEVTEKNVRGLLANRIENAKFVGPADVNGLAPPWRSNLDFFRAARADIDPGVSLSTSGSSQLLQSYAANRAGSQAMVQTHREVRAGEELEAVIWAKVRHHPAILELSLRPAAAAAEPYAVEEVEVTAPHWVRHSVVMKVAEDDPKAVFSCAILGAGVVWIDQIALRRAGEGNVSEEAIERLAPLRVPALRFPGGCLATNYRWVHGTGPVEHRPGVLDTVNHRVLNYDFGTDEYLELCLRQGIRPHITVNVASGTPQEARAWAEYVGDWYRTRAEEPPVAYFQVGNEDIGLQEQSHMTPEMYGEVLRAFVPEIRAGYPSARIVAVAEKHGETLGTEQAPWRRVVLPVAKELEIEVLVVHIYSMAWFKDETEQLGHSVRAVAEADEALRELLADCRQAGVGAAIGVTEWNYLTTASHWDGPKAFERSGAAMAEPYAAPHAVFAAGMLHNFARLAPDFELANFYHLINGMGVIQRRGIEVRDSPMASLFELYRPAFPGRRLDAELSKDDEEGDPIDVLALENDEGLWIFAVNASPVPRSVDLAGVDRGRVALAALTAERPGAPMLPAAAPSWGPEGIDLPPLSICRAHMAA